MKVIIYSDGGADPNPGIGGWAAILQYGNHEKVLTGNVPQATNNQMELQAAIAALQALTRPAEIEFHTDSEYVRRGITEWIDKWIKKGWLKGGNPIPNRELWQQLHALVQQHTIEWYWVKGHAGNPYNERVDQLARNARLEISPAGIASPNTSRFYIQVSCLGNSGPGGWGGVWDETTSDLKTFSGFVPQTTNNRLELVAAIEALKTVGSGRKAQLFTTSDYLFQGATQWLPGWRARQWHKKEGQPLANADLWQTLDRLLQESKIQWINLKGISDGEHLVYLNRAAQLAREASHQKGN